MSYYRAFESQDTRNKEASGSTLGSSSDGWPDELRLSDIDPWFVCKACGHRGADIRPDLQSAFSAVGP